MPFVLSLHFPAGGRRPYLHLGSRSKANEIGAGERRVMLAESANERAAGLALNQLERLAGSSAFRQLRPDSPLGWLSSEVRHAIGQLDVRVTLPASEPLGWHHEVALDF